MSVERDLIEAMDYSIGCWYMYCDDYYIQFEMYGTTCAHTHTLQRAQRSALWKASLSVSLTSPAATSMTTTPVLRTAHCLQDPLLLTTAVSFDITHTFG